MPAHKANHPYADRAALDRLLILIATIVHHPGIGGNDLDLAKEEGTALEKVKQQMHQLAAELQLNLPDYSIHTLRKDIGTLRRCGILTAPTYRQGYYLGTGVMTTDELRFALNALRSQAEYQQDAQVSRVYQTIMRRLKTSQTEEPYPVRSYINQPMVYTDPAEMMTLGKYERSLFDVLEQVEQAILQGQGIEIVRVRQGYTSSQKGPVQVYPLQLVYCDRAWYLLCEYCQTGKLAFHRIDRFDDRCQPLAEYQRSLTKQQHSVEKAHRLRRNGWGLYLGKVEEQRQELQGKAALVPITVRFFAQVAAFILEGQNRHDSQEITLGPKDKNGELSYVDYQVKLPQRSLDEFMHWVNKHMALAQIREPLELAQKHYQSALDLVQLYSGPADDS